MRFTGNLQRLSSGVAKDTGQEYQLRPKRQSSAKRQCIILNQTAYFIIKKDK